MILLVTAMLAMTVAVNGQDLTIEITKGVEGAIPIAIARFATQNPTLEDIGAIVSADLQRSAVLRPCCLLYC
jgi:TolB protein